MIPLGGKGALLEGRFPHLNPVEYRIIPDAFSRAYGVWTGESYVVDGLLWRVRKAFHPNAKLQTVENWSVLNAWGQHER